MLKSIASVGWAVIECDKNDTPIRIVRTGVRLFKSGTGTVSDIAAGKDESRNAARRSARLMRRNIWRRKRRVLKVYNILRNAGLLPMGAGFNDTPKQRTEVIQQLDKDLILQLKQREIDTDILPYTLRKLALNENLEPFALGRILSGLDTGRTGQNRNRIGTYGEIDFCRYSQIAWNERTGSVEI